RALAPVAVEAEAELVAVVLGGPHEVAHEEVGADIPDLPIVCRAHPPLLPIEPLSAASPCWGSPAGRSSCAPRRGGCPRSSHPRRCRAARRCPCGSEPDSAAPGGWTQAP